MKSLGFLTALLLTTQSLSALAFEDEALPPGSEPPPAPTASRKPRRNLIPAQKDAEGTEAPNRFQADTVIKSTYKLEGKTLEVDPD